MSNPPCRPLRSALSRGLPLIAALCAVPHAGWAAPSTAGAVDTRQCSADALQQSWNDGYVRGVEDIKAQLAAATARVQTQVQDQLNAQLATLQQQRDSDLGTRMRAAQQQALADAAATPMPSALTGAAAVSGPARPASQSAAPVGRMIIDNPQNLPPQLYDALMAYVKQ